MLKRLIEIYKYQSVRAVGGVLADLMGEIVVGKYAVVPLPTIEKHIRERGFDHTAMLAKRLGRAERVLVRKKNSVQVGASKEARLQQAKQAYLARGVKEDVSYLLLDDV